MANADLRPGETVRSADAGLSVLWGAARDLARDGLIPAIDPGPGWDLNDSRVTVDPLELLPERADDLSKLDTAPKKVELDWYGQVTEAP